MEKSKLQIRLNWFDRTVGFFSPRSLLKRKKAKIYNEYLSRKYEGADRGRRTAGWITTGGTANAEIAGSKITVRNRSRDLVRNNPYAARGIQVIANNVIGRGIMTQIKLDMRSEISTKEKRINNIWKAWANTTACDFEGIHNLAGMQRLLMRGVVESGDVLVRIRRVNRRFFTTDNGTRLELPPIQLQILEGDFIATNQINRVLDNGNVIIEGVEVDPGGKVVAYHLFKNHPGNININIQNTFDTIRIDASEILFLYRVDRPGQLTGMPWLSPDIIRLRDFDLYEDAQLKRQQCAAMFTAFVHDLEGIDDDEETKEQTELGEKMEPGLIEILPPGKTIELSDPPGADNYKEYTSVVLRSIAAGLGITYESLTGDLSDVNFSAGRMGWIEMQRNIDTWRANIMINQFLRPVFNWFKNSLELIGEAAPNARPMFTAPKREMIDPAKEVAANKIAVRNGFKTLSEVVRESGADPDVHFTEYASDNEMLDKKKLILDSDARKLDNAGKINTDVTSETENNTPPTD